MVPLLTRALVVLNCCVLGCLEATCADLQLGDRTRLSFATVAQARALLSERDDFVRRLGPFDRSARLKTERSIDEVAYLAFASDQAIEWTADEQSSMAVALEQVRSKLISLNLNWPDEVTLIKTTGREEGNAAYTRGASIIFPEKRLHSLRGDLPALLCHELFHVLSRHDRALRERLYDAIGFRSCPELGLPDSLRERRLTNPDGSANDHCIKITVADREQWAIPILYSKGEYNESRGGEFFDYLVFQFIVIDPPATATPTPQQQSHAKLVDGKPILVEPRDAVGFMEQIGRNTNYIIHPDEVLADNFVLIATEGTKVVSPEILSRIESILKASPR